MKDDKKVYIITENAANGHKVDRMLSDGGISTRKGFTASGLISVSSHCTGHYDNIPASFIEEVRCGDSRMYHHSELTPELVSTFPNAKPLITREHQAAMDQLAKCEEAEEAAATATNQARETLAEYDAT